MSYDPALCQVRTETAAPIINQTLAQGIYIAFPIKSAEKEIETPEDSPLN